jgi:hypothetical protein
MTQSIRRRLISGAAVVVVLGGLATAISPTVAAARPASSKLDGLSLDAATQSYTSSTHKHLEVNLSAGQNVQGGDTFSEADVTVTRKGHPEVHDWSFDLKKDTLTYNTKTGKGTLDVGSQLKPYAKIKLKIKAKGKKQTTKCGTYKTVTQPVKVKGSFSFNTKSTGKNKWGKVGGKSKKTFKGKSEVIYETGTFKSCGGNFTLPCDTGVTWNAFHQAGTSVDEVSMSGNVDTKHAKNSTLFALRNTGLSKPKNAVRTDTEDLPDKHMTFSDKKNMATVKIGASGSIVGSATLASTDAGTSFPVQCGKNNSKTETDTNWTAPYTNGKSPLKVKEEIEGPFKLPNIPQSASSTSIDQTVLD